ncbi:MAG TPA: BatD family protein [Ferruginibacter sp.]|nr:BatD family protein [Ferruginibacter sp.]
MQFLFTKIFLSGYLIINAFFLQAQVKVSANVSPAVIYQNEYATFRVVIENSNGVQKVAPPDFKNFYLVSGPNEEFWESSLNNQPAKKYYAVSYIVQPKASGKLAIGIAKVKVNGETYATASKQITVLKSITPGSNAQQNYPFTQADPFQNKKPAKEEFTEFILKKGDDVSKKISRNMQLVLETSKQTCYIGEPLVATYNLYTRLKSNSRLDKSPSFNGFSVIDLQQPDDYGFARKKWEGREYNVYSIRKVQLYPLQSGKFELEPATLFNEVQFLKPEAINNPDVIYNMYNGAGVNPDDIITENITLSSKPVAIEVKPFPEKDKPPDFNGAVGEFEISAAVEKESIATDVPGKLLIAISGSGNMELITVPDVKWPKGIEAYEVKLNDKLNTLAVPVSGTKYFDIPFSIAKEGNYTLPSIHFTYFDPNTAAYKKIATQPIAISVTKGNSTKGIFVGNNATAKEKLSPLNQLFQNRPLVVTIIAAFIIGGLIFWLRKEQKSEEKIEAFKRVEQAQQRKQDEELHRLFIQKASLVQNALKQTENFLYTGNSSEFYTALNKEFKNFLSEKLAIHREEISSKKIMYTMDKKGFNNEVILQAQNLLQDIDKQVYSPLPSHEGKQELYSRTQQFIQYLNGFSSDGIIR